jgi:hypothetical protein
VRRCQRSWRRARGRAWCQAAGDRRCAEAERLGLSTRFPDDPLSWDVPLEHQHADLSVELACAPRRRPSSAVVASARACASHAARRAPSRAAFGKAAEVVGRLADAQRSRQR